MSFTDSNLKNEVAELREKIEQIERYVIDQCMGRIVALERLERERAESRRNDNEPSGGDHDQQPNRRRKL